MKIEEIANDGVNFDVSIKILGDQAFNIGSSSLQFQTTDGAFGAPEILFSSVKPPSYLQATVTANTGGAYSFDFTLDAGPGKLVNAVPSNTELLILRLPIIDYDLAADGLIWLYNGTSQLTAVYLDDDVTQVFAINEQCLQGMTNSETFQNNRCELATPIIEGMYTESGHTPETNGASNLCFSGVIAEEASWYVYTASASGEATVSSSIDIDLPDTRVSVFEGNCDSLSCLASDDDSGEEFTSIVTFPVIDGDSYYIEWDDRWDDQEFDFEVTLIEVGVDSDNDGVLDLDDNCIAIENSDQLDLDLDDIGDVCDDDIDGDGVLNVNDCAPMDANLYPGLACNDGDMQTALDVIQNDCTCSGIPIPINIDCENAINVGEGTFTSPGAFAGGGASNNCELEAVNASWYAYTATESGPCLITSQIDSNLPDTRISVYSGTCANLSCIISNDDDGIDFTSKVTFDVLQGETYLLEWDDRWEGNEFDFEINFVEAIEGCTDNSACNYNNIAAIDNGICVYAMGCDVCTGEQNGTGSIVDNPEIGDACDDGNPSTLDDVFTDCFICGGVDISGCTSPVACNYDVLAVVDNGSCILFFGCDVCSGETDGTGYVIDMPDVGAPCDDGNALTSNDVLVDCNVCEGKLRLGCTDITACNYNVKATLDDGTCIHPTGCDECSTEAGVNGFIVDLPEIGDSCDDGEPKTIDDVIVSCGLCQGMFVFGCLSPTACNFDVAVTVNDGTCIFASGCDICSGESDGTGIVIDNPEPGDFCDDGDAGTTNDILIDCNLCLGVPVVNGCSDSAACNYDISVNVDDGSCVIASGCDTCSGETDGTGVLINNPEVGDFCDDGDATTISDEVIACGLCQGVYVFGCLDPTACNFDNVVTVDDGTCILPIGCDTCSGETDGTGVVVDNPDVGDLCDDGDTHTMNDMYVSCGTCQGVLIVIGCLDVTACNFDSTVNVDDGTCIYAIACDSCSGEIDGSGVVIDNPEVGDLCDDNDATTLNDLYVNCGVCQGVPIVNGCSDSMACNFDNAVNVNDGTCIFNSGCDTCSGETDGTGVLVDNPEVGDLCDDGDATTIDDIYVNCGLCQGVFVFGCLDATGCNYDSAVTVDDGSCIFASGCDSCSGEVDGTGVVVDNPEIGDLCDDGDATTIDDMFVNCGLCQGVFVFGCLDATGCNYDTAVTVDDGSCIFASGCDSCSGETDGSGVVVDNPEIGDLCDDGDATTINDMYVNCGLCQGVFVFGCLDATACNYDNAVTVDDGSCIFATGCDTCSGETDGTGVVVDNPEIGDLCDDGDTTSLNDMYVDCNTCQGTFIFGCLDPNACNFDSAGTVDDGSCVFASGCDICSGETDGSGVLVDNPEVGDSCDDGDSGTSNDIVGLDCVCVGVVCPTDFDGNGMTNGDDFGIFLGNFGLNCTLCPTDLNEDATTNGDDFGIFLGNFGLNCD